MTINELIERLEEYRNEFGDYGTKRAWEVAR